MDLILRVDGLKSSNLEITRFGSIVKECRELLSSFRNSHVKFVRRHANITAHSLTKVTIHKANCYYFMISLNILQFWLLFK